MDVFASLNAQIAELDDWSKFEVIIYPHHGERKKFAVADVGVHSDVATLVVKIRGSKERDAFFHVSQIKSVHVQVKNTAPEGMVRVRR